MLPPIADMIRITSVDTAPSCPRVWQTLASSKPKAPTAKAVDESHDQQSPERAKSRSTLKTSHAQINISTNCANASSELKQSLPAQGVPMVTRELSTRSRVPLSASSSREQACAAGGEEQEHYANRRGVERHHGIVFVLTILALVLATA